jgi:hypothetical protein
MALRARCLCPIAAQLRWPFEASNPSRPADCANYNTPLTRRARTRHALGPIFMPLTDSQHASTCYLTPDTRDLNHSTILSAGSAFGRVMCAAAETFPQHGVGTVCGDGRAVASARPAVSRERCHEYPLRPAQEPFNRLRMMITRKPRTRLEFLLHPILRFGLFAVSLVAVLLLLSWGYSLTDAITTLGASVGAATVTAGRLLPHHNRRLAKQHLE